MTDAEKMKIAVISSLCALFSVEIINSKGLLLITFESTVKEKYNNTALLLDFLVKKDYIVISNDRVKLTENGRKSAKAFMSVLRNEF